MSEKATNPKDIVAAGKLPLHLVPPSAIALCSLAMLEGASKYGRANWREGGVKWTVYYDAARRHLDCAFEGEETDPDSGLPHLAHAMACICIIIDAEMTGTLLDDRQYKGEGYRAFVESLVPHVAKIRDKYADRTPHHFTISDGRA